MKHLYPEVALQAFLDQFPFLSPESRALMADTIELKSFPKGTIWLKEGQVSDVIYLIRKGAARIFFYKDGDEKTDWMAFEGDLMMAPYSFFTQGKGMHLIDTIEDTEAYCLSYQQLEALYAQSHELEKMGRLITINSYLLLYHRLAIVNHMSAKDRYLDLLQKQPKITQRVPLTYIASYLNMSLETLSRIRAQLR